MTSESAPGEVAADVMNAATASGSLSRVSGSAGLPFDGQLRDLCDQLAAKLGRPDGPALTCSAVAEALPLATATMLARIAELLVTNAFVHAFPQGRGGRVAVSFAAREQVWELTVDDSGIVKRSRDRRRDDRLTFVQQLLMRVDGRLEVPKVTGGTRCTVTLPRRRA
jgi:two-component sensor histidine kinase